MRQRSTKPNFSREFNCAYLYSDGTLVQMFEERRDGVRLGETADVTLGYANVSIYPSYDESRSFGSKPSSGRVVLHRYRTEGIIKLMKGATVTAIKPSVLSGSENSKKIGLEVGYFKVKTQKFGELEWTVLGNIISSEFTIQPEAEKLDYDKVRIGGHWGDVAIAKVTDLRPKPQAVESAS